MTSDDHPTPSTTAPERVERASRVVAASAPEIFELLADPNRHAEIDGSGTVRAPTTTEVTRLTLGARFGMRMRLGVPYRITNEVVEFDEPTRIAWRHLGGHIWRYTLRPVDGGTEVTEEFDWRTSRSPLMLRMMNAPTRNRASIEATLDRLAERFAPSI